MTKPSEAADYHWRVAGIFNDYDTEGGISLPVSEGQFLKLPLICRL